MSKLDPFGGPFNGQLGRSALVNELLEKFSFRAIVETGTFTGSTTEYLLCQSSAPVYSVDTDLERAQASAVRLAPFRDRVHLSCGDSRELLTKLAVSPQFPHKGVFFYLDAHWNEVLPLREEVEIILKYWKKSVVMVDDFRVPNDDGYEYDSYGEGRTLCLEYLEQQISTLPVFFPAIPSHEETGRRRGCVVFGTDAEAGITLQETNRLSLWPMKPASVSRSDTNSLERDLRVGMIPKANEIVATKMGSNEARYLLVKAHVGFGDRLQALSHAMKYATKYQRTLCVDWSDSIWSDGTINFDTFFDICGVPVISPNELFEMRIPSVSPMGWVNQLERRADLRFLNRTVYHNLLADEDNPAEVLVYGSIGTRIYHRDNLNQLRVKKEFRDAIVSELIRYQDFDWIVHLRGTDRRQQSDHDQYLSCFFEKLDAIPKAERLLVVSDSLPLFRQLHSRFPRTVLRTPHLEQFDTVRGTHFQTSISKNDYNLQMLIDFFLLVYAPNCISDGESIFSLMARFLHEWDHADILGYDR
jgi:hypothetical protein